MKKLFSILILLFVFTACKTDENTEQDLDINEDFQTVEINDYRLKLPNYMKEMTDLNEDASLQYASVGNKIYAILIDEPYDELNTVYKEYVNPDRDFTFSDYAELIYSSVDENMKVEKKEELKTTRINGLKAKILNVTGTIDGIKMKFYYQYVFYEGPDKYYTLMMWTFDENKESLLGTIEQISNSFEVIK